MTRAQNNIFSILDFKVRKTRIQCKTPVDKDIHFSTTYFDQQCDVSRAIYVLYLQFRVPH